MPTGAATDGWAMQGPNGDGKRSAMGQVETNQLGNAFLRPEVCPGSSRLQLKTATTFVVSRGRFPFPQVFFLGGRNMFASTEPGETATASRLQDARLSAPGDGDFGHRCLAASLRLLSMFGPGCPKVKLCISGCLWAGLTLECELSLCQGAWFLPPPFNHSGNPN